MNTAIVLSFICAIFFSLLFAFPKYFLSKVGYKGNYHPEDIKFSDVTFFYIIFGILMIGSWVVLFMTLSELSLPLYG